MSVLTRRTVLLATLALVVCSRAVAGNDSHVFMYHGWHFDLSRASEQPRDTVEAALRKQIDGIETLGIAQDIIAFMRKVPLHAETEIADGAPAHYERATGVAFRVDALQPHKPVLLHELLRAFHEQKLGYDDSTIIEAYQKSRASGLWPADSAMLKSVQNFFAATATVYLAGEIETPPFTPGRLRAAQPVYWKWLGDVFDGFRGCE